MTYGLRIENLSGTLVVAAEGRGYRYWGRATSYTLTPRASGAFGAEASYYRFEFTLPSATDVPVCFVGLDTGKVWDAGVCWRKPATSSTWWFELTCYTLATAESATPTDAVPDVYVFCPMSSSGSTYGLQLFNAAGQLTADFTQRPLFLRKRIDFPSRSPRSTWVTGDDAPGLAGITTAAALGWIDGLDAIDAGNSSSDWIYGYTRIGDNLARRRMWSSRDTQGGGSGSVWYLNPGTALVIDATGLP